jgi:hypothetical protein
MTAKGNESAERVTLPPLKEFKDLQQMKLEKELKQKLFALEDVERLQKKKEGAAFRLMQAATIEHYAAVLAYDTIKVGAYS